MAAIADAFALQSGDEMFTNQHTNISINGPG